MPAKKKSTLAKPYPSGVKKGYSNKLLEWTRKKFGKGNKSLLGGAVTGMEKRRKRLEEIK